ncbi:MAG: hypothetical protein II351_00490 [Clostridia bacterium]|nr:hypothetical protein [Clostridia bacterium]
MNIFHYFAGGNTPLGFYSYYEEVLPPAFAQKTIYIKGGPGTGKSTLMKRLGARWAEQGQTVEFLHCSGDPISLDGVVSRKKGWSVLDATAPHAQDPKLLGAVDLIFDPGRFVDPSVVKPYRERLLELTAAKKACYARAYRYLSMAGTLFSGITKEQEKALFPNSIAKTAKGFYEEFFAHLPLSERRGRLSHAFARAITPMGVMGYFDTLFSGNEVCVLHTENGVGADEILKQISEMALARGISVQAYCSPLFPAKFEHLVLKDLHLAITTEDLSCKNAVDIIDYVRLERINRDLSGDLQLFSLLLERTVIALRCAKEEHARMEEILVPSMDFEGMQDEFSQILSCHGLS